MVFAVNSVESSQRNFAAFQALAEKLNGTSTSSSGTGSSSASAPSSSSTGNSGNGANSLSTCVSLLLLASGLAFGILI